jgi:hypothetical protein
LNTDTPTKRTQYQVNSSRHNTEPLDSDVWNFLTADARPIPPAILLNTPDAEEQKTTASGYA